MAKLFSVAAWNVEHFKDVKKDPARVDRVIQYLADRNPDKEGAEHRMDADRFADIGALIYDVKARQITYCRHHRAAVAANLQHPVSLS